MLRVRLDCRTSQLSQHHSVVNARLAGLTQRLKGQSRRQPALLSRHLAGHIRVLNGGVGRARGRLPLL